MRKPTSVSSSAPEGGFAAVAAGLLEKLPNVFACLADPKYDDGSPRELGSLTLFCEGGEFKVCLSDRSQGLVCFRAGRSLEEALKALEKALEGGSADWRPSKASGKRR